MSSVPWPSVPPNVHLRRHRITDSNIPMFVCAPTGPDIFSVRRVRPRLNFVTNKWSSLSAETSCGIAASIATTVPQVRAATESRLSPAVNRPDPDKHSTLIGCIAEWRASTDPARIFRSIPMDCESFHTSRKFTSRPPSAIGSASKLKMVIRSFINLPSASTIGLSRALKV